MASIVNFDRDLRWLEMKDFEHTLNPNIAYTDPVKCRTDGVVYEDIVSFHTEKRSTHTIASGDVTTLGRFIKGPDETNGSAYRIKGCISSTHDGVATNVFVGIGDASPANTSSGQVVLFTQPVQAQTRGGDGIVDETIYINPFGTISAIDYSSRALVVGVMWYNHTAGALSPIITCSLGIQRLSVKPPEYQTAIR
jgi:hypothetical protein